MQRVWSLLKSPESESKMSSMKIPAFDLHMSWIVVLMHDAAMYECFLSLLKVCICQLTSSGSALRLIVLCVLMRSSLGHADGNTSAQTAALLSADEM